MTYRSLVLALCFLPSLVLAQTPRVMSYQGLLTDSSGQPISDAARLMAFRIYETESSPDILWQETQSVPTSEGIFNVVLGSVNPITIDLHRELWLGISVETIGPLAPRTRLTSALRALDLAMPFRDTFRVVRADLGTDGSESVNEDVTVHAADAHIGLYSDALGVAGSGIQFGEIAAGVLTNKWSVYRETSGAGSSLLFTHGEDPRYGQNPLRVEFEPGGDVVIGGAYRYQSPETRVLQLPAAAFRMAAVMSVTENTPDWREINGYIECYACYGGDEFFTAPVHLPDGAEVKSFTLYYMDNDAIHDTAYDFSIWRRALLSSGTQGFGSSPVTTSGASTTIHSKTVNTDTNANRIIDNANYMYWAKVTMDHVTSNSWSARRFYGMSIEYTIDRVE